MQYFFQFDYYFFIFIGYLLLLIAVSYAIVIWCNYNIYNYLKDYNKTAFIYSSIPEIHTQVGRTLVIQALIPLITLGVPSLLLIAVLLLPISIPNYCSATLGLFLSYIPLANGLSRLFCVKAYNQFTRSFIKKLVKNVFQKNVVFAKMSITHS